MYKPIDKLFVLWDKKQDKPVVVRGKCAFYQKNHATTFLTCHKADRRTKAVEIRMMDLKESRFYDV